MTLVLLLHRCPDQLAADMRREYGLAVRDLPPMQAALLAVNLPDGSRVWQELNTARAWTFDQYLAVLRIEQMNLWMWGNEDPKKRGPRPNPLPRPGNPLPKSSHESGQQPENPDGNTVRRTRTIKAVGMTVEQLDRFMNQRFTTVNSVRNRPQTGQP
jgi:hypothetical protein